MKLLIIGLGSIGTRHLTNALALGCEVWIHEPDESRRQAAAKLAHGVLETWTDQRFDAVMVCSPAETHLQLAQKAVSMRIPVFVEKPLGALDQIEDWRRLVAEARDLTTQVGYVLRFHPVMRAMKAMQPTDGLLSVECNMRTWPGSARDGVPLLECSHEIDAALWFGAPQRVSAGRSDGRGSGIVIGAFSIAVNPDSDKYHRVWDVSNEQVDCRVVFHSPEALGAQMYEDELLHFLDCVHDKRQTDCPLADGLTVLEVCQQIEQKAAA